MPSHDFFLSFVCVCVCVCERECVFVFVCLRARALTYVCVCVRERERVRAAPSVPSCLLPISFSFNHFYFPSLFSPNAFAKKV